MKYACTCVLFAEVNLWLMGLLNTSSIILRLRKGGDPPRDLERLNETPNVGASLLVGRAIEADTRQKVSANYKNAAATGSVDNGPKSFNPFLAGGTPRLPTKDYKESFHLLNCGIFWQIKNY